VIQKTPVEQGFSLRALEGRCPAEFRSKPEQADPGLQGRWGSVFRAGAKLCRTVDRIHIV